MYPEILTATYSAKDCAYALQHGAFSNFRRDLTRGGHLFFPRKTAPGPGGGEYRYAHILEMAIHMTIGSYRDRHLARSVVWGLHNLLQGNEYGCKKLNADTQENRNIIWFGGSDFEENDFPPHTPHDATRIVDFPSYYLGDDFISRDEDQPIYLIYDNAAHKAGAADVELIPDMTLKEAHQRIVKLKTQYAANAETEAMRREESSDMPILNLTDLLSAVDQRLKLRLDAQAIRGA
ncbi:hypothetical protein J7481_22655 [Labrenzia sp. R4_2]|uniref:hypothetical protein n=1 Tax=Labrenzia sp. R4_2 TaxID=2821107 RepID=UPI001AD953A8|nr:hypothetical protein [Labrenzia sp. R4_2]MBO9422329.1 hypothetical protein [Labrenzia sp. R4_2]